MPNWCQNQLAVDEPMSDELRAYLKENGFSFSKIAPCAEDCQSQVNAWGTKWDISEEEQKEVARGLLDGDLVEFNTAWSPPQAAICKLSEMFPEDYFRLLYVEYGMMFCGESNFSDGCESEDFFEQSDKESFNKFVREEMGHEPWDEEEEEEEESQDETQNAK
jgi:hypothetical protein